MLSSKPTKAILFVYVIDSSEPTDAKCNGQQDRPALGRARLSNVAVVDGPELVDDAFKLFEHLDGNAAAHVHPPDVGDVTRTVVGL